MSKPFLKEQFRKLSALRNAPTDEFAVAALVEQWQKILGNVGEKRFADGISNCVRYMSFFPTVGELEDKIPTDNTERYCPKCRDREGWEDCEVRSMSGTISMGVRKCRHM